MIETEGYFLKMNCKVLDSAQLKKLDKQEKVLTEASLGLTRYTQSCTLICP